MNPDYDENIARHRLHTRLTAAVGAYAADHDEPSTPLMVVDLDAFDRNAADLVRRAAGTPIRLASKSIRVPALLRRALATQGFSGILAYTLAEAHWLHDQGISDDIVVAYPTVDRPALRRLVESPSAASAITLMVDSSAHLDVVDSLRTSRAVPIRVALDVDAGLDLRGHHVGPKRSPLRTPREVAALGRAIVSRAGFHFAGVMTYEGHVAGVPDVVPGERAKSLLVRRMKSAALSQLAQRRSAIATALCEVADYEFWNAGGTGSIETSAADPVVTEVSAGSGLLVPTLFDHYEAFRAEPAAFFGLPLTRQPSASVATVHGGGFSASGAAGSDRSPTPWTPPGLELTTIEGAGEVQTPLTGSGVSGLKIGDLVWFRHAKSGELFEHGTQVYLLEGDRFTDRVSTYRGEGLAF